MICSGTRVLELTGDPRDYRDCGPCRGERYYGLDFKDTCMICSGTRVLELTGDPRDYRDCGPCRGEG